LLAALDFRLGKPVEIALAGEHDSPEFQELLRPVRARYLPNRLLAAADPGLDGAAIPLLGDRIAVRGRATAYLCEDFVCQAPTSDPAELERQLERTVSPSASPPAVP
jgi:uncharacterized protein YyaL (SSP411 family)